MDLKIIVILVLFATVEGQFFEDRRCRCVCPSPATILNSTVTRQIYTGNVTPNQCTCEGVVYPLISKELEGKVHLFCPRCECIYQTRNTTLIMGVVSAIVISISLSTLYMLSVTWLKYMFMRRRAHQEDMIRPVDVIRGRDHTAEEEHLLMNEDPEN